MMWCVVFFVLIGRIVLMGLLRLMCLLLMSWSVVMVVKILVREVRLNRCCVVSGDGLLCVGVLSSSCSFFFFWVCFVVRFRLNWVFCLLL